MCTTDAGKRSPDRWSGHGLDLDNAREGERQRRFLRIKPVDLGVLHLDVHLHRSGRRWTRVVLQRLDLVIGLAGRLRGPELGLVRRSFVLRGRRLRGPSAHVRRDNLVGSEARRLLGPPQFGLVRDEFVLHGGRLHGPSVHVRRNDLVGSEARRLLGSPQFGLVRDEFVLHGGRLHGPSAHVQWDDVVNPAID